MSEQNIQSQTMISCEGAPTRDWYAWNDLMPPRPDYFHVIGEVQVPNPGVIAKLCPKEPQGTNPAILMMDLILIQQPGIWVQVLTWTQASYDKVIVGEKYKTVEIYCKELIATIEVEDIH